MKYEHLPKESVRQYVYRVLNNQIQLCELKPGTMLSENGLASELGVSRTPVREALQDLAAQNLVEILPQRGNRVTLLDVNRIEDGFFVREALEMAVVEQLCDEMSAEDFERLERDTLSLLEICRSGGMTKELFLENGYHKLLFESCGRLQMFYHMRYFSAHSNRFQKLRSGDENYMAIIQDHLDILDAIKRGDKREARGLMRSHIHKSFLDLDVVRGQYPQYFL